MSAGICVDYLTHEWDSSDIVQANHEIKRQLLQIKKKRDEASSKDRKPLQIEHDRLLRFQNAVWRQMARICTNQLGGSNEKVNPSTVNWQKESDITWLYGPLYTTKPSMALPPTPPPEGIKSVLKKPASSLRLESLSQNDYRPWSKTCSEPGAPISVRFNPDIEKLEYLPESPVKETLAIDKDYWSLLEDEDEEDEDDILWSMVVHLSSFVKNKSAHLASSFLPTFLKSRQCKLRQGSQQPQLHSPSNNLYQSSSSSSEVSRERPIHIAVIFYSMSKSLTSLVGTWLMYQSLLPFTWLIKHHSKKNHQHQHQHQHHTTF